MIGERLAVIVHDRWEAEAASRLAAEAGREVDLLVPVGLAGPAFAKALEELLAWPVVAYCDDRPGLALESLRVGLRQLVIEASSASETAAAARLADIARQQGATLAATLPAPLYDVSADARRLVPAVLGATGPLVP